jgi:hypothetical protein
MGALAAASALAAPAAGSTEGADGMPRDHGLPWSDNDAYVPCGRIGPQRLAPWTSRLHHLADLLASTPGSTGPQVWARWQAVILGCEKPFRGDLIDWPWPERNIRLQSDPGQPGRTRAVPQGETSMLPIHINHLDWLEAPSDLNDSDAGEGRLGVARVTRRIDGFPVLANRVLLLTRPGREPYRPVTLEAALKAWVAHAPPSHEFSPRASQILTQLDAAALRAPAYVLDDRSTGRRGIVGAPQSGALPLLTINPDYMDPALPPQAAQGLAVDLLGMEIDLPASDRRQSRPLARHLVEAADWQRVATELGR